MRWERLFADLEASTEELERQEREALVRDLRDETWAETSWVDLLGGVVRLDVRGVGPLEGVVETVGPTLLRLVTATATLLVSRSAVVAVLATGDRSVAADEGAQRLGWRPVLRALRDDEEDVEVLDVAGGTVRGRVDVVGADFVRVRRTDDAVVAVVLDAVALVRISR